MPLTDSPHEGRHVEVGDTRLFVVERGVEGYPLICLHPLGHDHWTFADYLDGLAPEVHVVLPDLRGHGMSDPAKAAPVRQLSDDVTALADALGLERYALLSFRNAFTVAVQNAAEQSGRVTHLAVVAPNGRQGDRIRDRALAGEYERRTAPAVVRPELAEPRTQGESGRASVAVLVLEDTAYPFVEEQERFLDRVRAFVLRNEI